MVGAAWAQPATAIAAKAANMLRVDTGPARVMIGTESR